MKPYERQEGESAQAYAALQVYLDLGDERSLAKASQKVGKHKHVLELWSRKWSWVDRARAWDDYLSEEIRRSQIREIREMHRRHARAFAHIFGKGLGKLKKTKCEVLTVREALDYVIEAAKGERQARGEPGEVVEQQQREVDEDERREKFGHALKDQEARDLLLRLSERLTGSPVDPVRPAEAVEHVQRNGHH